MWIGERHAERVAHDLRFTFVTPSDREELPMESQMATANLFLGIIALTSALEALVFVGLCVFATIVLRRAARAARRLDAQQITPALGKVNAILDDARCVSSRLHDGAGRFETVVRAAVNMVRTVFENSPGAGASKRQDHVM
jgi:hypothetical protein